MKLIYLFLFFPIMFACKSNQLASNKSRQNTPEVSCPKGGDCIFEVLKNSILELKKDDFGKLYPEISSGNKIVIKYHFKKEPTKNTLDSSYSEFVYFEIDNDVDHLILNDYELQNVKMIFGRICFCRGSMGYFKVTKGKLFLFNHNNKLNINLNFTVDKIPQILTGIHENISY